jgi:hypothetical protein
VLGFSGAGTRWHTTQATAVCDGFLLHYRYKFTAEDVQRMVEEKRQRGGRNTAAERTRLSRQMTYATEQGDLEEAARYITQLNYWFSLQFLLIFFENSSKSIGAAPLASTCCIAEASTQLQRISVDVSRPCCPVCWAGCRRCWRCWRRAPRSTPSAPPATTWPPSTSATR